MARDAYLERTYKLKLNPFASRTDPSVEMAGRKKEKGAWTAAIQSRVGATANALHFVVGDYGSGKSLSLHKIKEQFSTDPRVLAIFMKMLPEDRVTRFGVDFVKRLFRAIPAATMTGFRSNDVDELRKVYDEAGRLFGRIAFGDDDALRYVRGEASVTSAALAKWGIHRKLDTTEIAEEYLVSFLFLLKGLAVDTLLVAVDEVEYIFSQMRGTNIGLVFNTLRSLYDLADSDMSRRLPSRPANLVMVLAVSSAGWKKLYDLSKREQSEGGPIQPLMRRFGEVIELEALNHREARQLVESRLRRSRVDETIKDQPLIPYDEGFVGYVYELSTGNPGEIVKYCDIALEDGLREKTKLLDRKFAERVFRSHKLIAEEVEA